MPSSTAAQGAEPFVPDRPSLKTLREAVQGCRGCELYRDATQAVMGAGPRKARLMLVGEQPGDREDVEGEPFVGPAGRILDESLKAAEISRGEVYLTNAVKHFKWKAGRGKRRIHQRPSVGEMNACRPWLEAELAVVKPEVVVALGATAARSVLGPGYKVTKDRGTFVEVEGTTATGTIHPSALLRIDDAEERRLAKAEFIRDLSQAAAKLG